jgi:hypothetical protein
MKSYEISFEGEKLLQIEEDIVINSFLRLCCLIEPNNVDWFMPEASDSSFHSWLLRAIEKFKNISSIYAACQKPKVWLYFGHCYYLFVVRSKFDSLTLQTLYWFSTLFLARLFLGSFKAMILLQLLQSHIMILCLLRSVWCLNLILIMKKS